MSINLVPESSYVREEARIIIEVPLAIMPPLSYATSSGTSLKSTSCSKVPLGGTKEKKAAPTRPTTGAIGLKRKASEVSGPSKHALVTPSGNLVSRTCSSLPFARSCLSYTMIGVCKPDGGYEKVLSPVRNWQNLQVRPLESRGLENYPQSSDPQDNMRAVMRKMPQPRVLPSPLLASKMLPSGNSFRA
jgi:hypothetical protein